MTCHYGHSQPAGSAEAGALLDLSTDVVEYYSVIVAKKQAISLAIY